MVTHMEGRDVWEWTSHQVKLQLIIIVINNKACHKGVEPC